jgi:hypothetical protein
MLHGNCSGISNPALLQVAADKKSGEIWGIENVYPTSDGEGGIYAVNGGRMLTIVKAHLQ